MSAQAYEDEGQKIAASLLLESRMPAAGTETTLAIRMSPQACWHGYWLNPGDAGFPLQLQWHLPEGGNGWRAAISRSRAVAGK
ncbi:hypothetical protein [Shewanella algae]|uniref:hypothetical protein n=1 Tax=Shewanella algae TaxID=38313 RepID=UPI001FBA525A|nr:hypothetical protein [Shewanella algae]